MDILFGTKNKYKATEMVSLLGKFPNLNIHYLADLNLNIKIDENQKTLKKNAEKKAVEISKLTDFYVLASDGGVDIPGLGKKWDILKNQRTVGENNTDLEKVDKLLEIMQGLKNESRKAVYYLSLALAKNGVLIWSTEQIYDEGFVAEKPPDRNIPKYLWLSHLWYYPHFKKVFNKLSKKEKEEVRKQGLGIKGSLQRKIREIIVENELDLVLQKKGRSKDVPIAFIFKNNKLLIGLRNYTPNKWKNVSVWTVPGGRCDSNETLETTIKREVLEEVGIADIKITEYLGSVPGAKDGDVVFVFKAETTQEPKLMEPEKFSEWKWCKVSEIPSNFINQGALKLINV